MKTSTPRRRFNVSFKSLYNQNTMLYNVGVVFSNNKRDLVKFIYKYEPHHMCRWASLRELRKRNLEPIAHSFEYAVDTFEGLIANGYIAFISPQVELHLKPTRYTVSAFKNKKDAMSGTPACSKEFYQLSQAHRYTRDTFATGIYYRVHLVDNKTLVVREIYQK